MGTRGIVTLSLTPLGPPRTWKQVAPNVSTAALPAPWPRLHSGGTEITFAAALQPLLLLYSDSAATGLSLQSHSLLRTRPPGLFTPPVAAQCLEPGVPRSGPVWAVLCRLGFKR